MTSQMVFHKGNCLNTKKPYARACRLCIESCPHQAISEDRQLIAQRCTECGVCMAACPSDGFVDQTMDKLHGYLFEQNEVVLNCPQAIALGFEIPCIGILDRDGWMTLLLLAKKKPVTILTGVCAECEDRLACNSSVQIFKLIHKDWPEHSSIQIQVRPDKETVRSPAVMAPSTTLKSDKGLGWRQKSMEKIGEWLPNLAADETYPIPKYRQWLIEALGHSSEEKIPFWALAVEDSCTSCGVCAAICPQGALQKKEEMSPISEDPAKEDKISLMRLVLEPQKCVHCSRCVETCRSQALSFSLKPLSQRLFTGKILIHEGTPRYCSRCGKRIFDHAELCLVCSTSDPSIGGFAFP